MEDGNSIRESMEEAETQIKQVFSQKQRLELRLDVVQKSIVRVLRKSIRKEFKNVVSESFPDFGTRINKGSFASVDSYFRQIDWSKTGLNKFQFLEQTVDKIYDTIFGGLPSGLQ